MEQGHNSQYETYTPLDFLTQFADSDSNRVRPYFAGIGDTRDFMARLVSFGLNKLECDVVVGRIIYDKTYAELAADWGEGVAPAHVFRVFQDAKKQIEEAIKNEKE